MPELAISDLVPAYSGIRAKLISPRECAKNILQILLSNEIQNSHVGIESPGSAPSIAEDVQNLVADIVG